MLYARDFDTVIKFLLTSIRHTKISEIQTGNFGRIERAPGILGVLATLSGRKDSRVTITLNFQFTAHVQHSRVIFSCT